MRVLFTCVVGVGHFNPMVPLAKALQAAGHAVAVATDPSFVAHVRAIGFDATPAGLDMVEAKRRMIATVPDWASVEPWDQVRYIVPGVFAGTRVEPMLRDLERILPEVRPDLLIHDPGEMAGPIAAERFGIPHVEHSFGILRLRDLMTDAMRSLDAICDRLGLRNPGIGSVGGEPYLDICPPGIQRPRIAELASVLPMRPVGFDDAPDAPLPAWLDQPRERPLVYVTLGTEFNRKPAVFGAILDGLARGPFDVVVTVGPTGDPEALGPRPDHVRIERFVPQSKVLARCAVFVSHGSSGALLGAVRAGVPILAIPQGADQFSNAERIEETGIGLRLLPGDFDADAVGVAVRRLHDEPSYATTIRSHQASIEAMPTPEAVVPVLERLAQSA